MEKPGIILFFLILLCLSSCFNARYKEIKPGFGRDSAPEIQIPIQLKGKIENNEDLNYYKIVLNSSQTNIADIELTTDMPNPLQLNLYNSNSFMKGEYLLIDDSQQGPKKIFFRNIYFQPGVYYLRVSLHKNDLENIHYYLSITTKAFDVYSLKEPSYTMEQANYINITNGFVKAYYDTGVNVTIPDQQYEKSDWYYFDIIQSNQILSIEITGVPNADPSLELYDQSAGLLRKVDSFGVDEPEILKNFGIRIPGRYYLKVYNKNKFAQNLEVPYQLYLKLHKPDPVFEFEDNNSMQNANPLNGRIYGYINPAGDSDYYKFYIKEAKKVINLTLTPLNNIIWDLNIYNQAGEEIYSIKADAKNQPVVIPNLLLKNGEYFISVSDLSNLNQNYQDYYSINVKESGFEYNTAYKPDNSFLNANAININQSCKGYIICKNDQDVFTFTLDNEKRLKIDVSPVSQIDFVILLYNENKKLLKVINKCKRGEAESAIIDFKPGKYYLILKDVDNRFNPYENYVLSIFER